MEKKEDSDAEEESTEENQVKVKSKALKAKSTKYVTVRRKKDPMPLKYFKKFIYNYDHTFRFTSRYWNTIMVALVALYYVVLYWSYTISMYASYWIDKIPFTVDSESIQLNWGDLVCNALPDACLEQFEAIGPIKLPLPKKIVHFFPDMKASLLAIVIVPLFGSLLICLLQVFFLVRETKKHLQQMYKGNCDFVRKAEHLNKGSIASSSFHFGG